jgi:hypothetical protein
MMGVMMGASAPPGRELAASPIIGRRRRIVAQLMDSPGVKLTTRLMAAVTLGYFVNVLSEASSNSRSIGELPARLGWWIILAPIGAAMLIFDLFSDLRSDRRTVEAERDAHLRSLRRVVDVNDRITAAVLLLLAKSGQSPNFNIHLFYRGDIGGRAALVKDRRLAYETEHFPANYALDHAFPDTDELVICDAFNFNEIRYEELPVTHPQRYNERIKSKVDPQISWVLAAPMHVENSQPAGVICAFGEQRVFADPVARRSFESLLALAGSVMSASRSLIEDEQRDVVAAR